MRNGYFRFTNKREKIHSAPSLGLSPYTLLLCTTRLHIHTCSHTHSFISPNKHTIHSLVLRHSLSHTHTQLGQAVYCRYGEGGEVGWGHYKKPWCSASWVQNPRCSKEMGVILQILTSLPCLFPPLHSCTAARIREQQWIRSGGEQRGCRGWWVFCQKWRLHLVTVGVDTSGASLSRTQPPRSV